MTLCKRERKKQKKLKNEPCVYLAGVTAGTTAGAVVGVAGAAEDAGVGAAVLGCDVSVSTKVARSAAAGEVGMYKAPR